LSNTPVAYHFPNTVQEAVALKQQYGEAARFIAGGTDLLLLMEQQHVRPQSLIDLTRIPELQRLEVSAEQVNIGSAVTYRHLLADEALCAVVPFLAKAIRTIGGVQVRSVATLAGNIANASPAGDTLPCLYVLNATIHTAGPDGERAIPIDEFILGVRRVALQPAELITRVTFEPPTPDWQGAFEKLGLRQAMAISVVNTALLIRQNDGHVADARIALGAVAPTVICAPEAEAVLIGYPLDADRIELAGQRASAAATPIDDIRASASYRRLVAGGLVRRALQSCCRQMEPQE
jgi:CO/xanthine dehydrogenase FAD-binding subunit